MSYAANVQTRFDMHIPNALELESDQEGLGMRNTSVGAITTRYAIPTTTSQTPIQPEGTLFIQINTISYQR